MPPLTEPPLFHFASDSDDQDAVEALDESSRQGILTARPKSKMSGACADCKAVKVRCEVIPEQRKCRRCELKNLPCTPRERKKRKPADTHEELQERARNQDRRIQQLLREYDKMKADHKIRQWITKSHPISTLDGYDGMAECYKWMQGGTSPEDAVALSFGLPDRTHVPEIVKHCALYPEEIVELFSLFFKHVNPYFSILDEALHTPHHLIQTSPFLFTVLCAVSSRYYVSRPEIYPLAMDFARDAAGKGLVEGKQSVDMCQAYLIMAVYPVPKKKWVEDRSWLLMGVAIRMAMELRLNQPPPLGLTERERLNYTRTWLNCYCVDGSHAIQFGKMPMLPLDDYLARFSRNWYRSSQMNTAFDVHLVAYVQILLLMSQWKSIVAQQSRNESAELIEAAIQMHGRLTKEMDHWVGEYAHELSYHPLPICIYRGNTTQMISAYLKLVVLSSGFQAALRKGLSRDSEIFQLSLEAARSVIQIMVERLAPTGFLRFAMDANFLYVSYAAAFLINLLRPKLLPLLNEMQQKEIILTVTNLIKVLGSPDVALDGRHTPALYSKFLSSLLRQYCPISELVEYGAARDAEEKKPSTLNSQDGGEVYYWPDVSSTGLPRVPDTTMPGMIYQEHGDPDMDFSLNHFVKTVAQDFPPSTADDPVFWGGTEATGWHHHPPSIGNSGPSSRRGTAASQMWGNY